jgi:DNA repair protein RecO (recombination protein O)
VAIFRDEVTILKSYDLGEYDKILRVFGKRRGNFSAVAKGVRRLSSRKSGHLQTFNLCKLACAEGKSLDVIVEAEEYFILDTQDVGVDEYKRIGFAGMVLDKFLPQGISDTGVFEMWQNFIRSDRGENATWNFVIGVLDKQGFVSQKSKEDLVRLADKYSKLKVLRSEVERILENI